ncbi:hypothetical protein MRX96_016406 [Rhipicephalus microplus]
MPALAFYAPRRPCTADVCFVDDVEVGEEIILPGLQAARLRRPTNLAPALRWLLGREDDRFTMTLVHRGYVQVLPAGTSTTKIQTGAAGALNACVRAYNDGSARIEEAARRRRFARLSARRLKHVAQSADVPAVSASLRNTGWGAATYTIPKGTRPASPAATTNEAKKECRKRCSTTNGGHRGARNAPGLLQLTRDLPCIQKGKERGGPTESINAEVLSKEVIGERERQTPFCLIGSRSRCPWDMAGRVTTKELVAQARLAAMRAKDARPAGLSQFALANDLAPLSRDMAAVSLMSSVRERVNVMCVAAR